MRVLIIGLGNPAPTFIFRRLCALSRHKVSLTIVAHWGQSVDLPEATIVRIAAKFTLGSTISSLSRAFLYPHLFLKLISMRKELSPIRRFFWTLKHIPVIVVKKPDVIHLQWLGSVAEWTWLRHFFTCPIIASARGSQVTVYPVTKPGYRSLVELVIREVDYIHCVSKDIEQVCKSLGARNGQLIVNYNGIDLNRFKPSSISINRSTITLISVGSLMWRKGFIFQLQILQGLLKNNFDACLHIIGRGDDLEGLLYLAHRLGVDQRVLFEGQKSTDAVIEFLQRGDVYLATSAAEGLPNSVVEAAACGLPVVAFESEGIREIVEEGETGFIVAFGDVLSAVERIIQLTDERKRAAMGLKARARIEKYFDEEMWVSKMVSEYGNLASRNLKA